MITAAGTGLRWGELTGLSPAAVDLRRARLYVDRTLVDLNGQLSFGEPKTRGSRRVVSLSPLLVDGLAEQLTQATHDLVFPSPGGEPLRRSNFYYRTWRPAIQAAGLQPAPRFYDLRHSHVAMLIAAGVPVKAIQDRLGHASIVTTMDRYGHRLQTVDATVLAAVDSGLSTIGRSRPQDGAAPAVGDTSEPHTPVLPAEGRAARRRAERRQDVRTSPPPHARTTTATTPEPALHPEPRPPPLAIRTDDVAVTGPAPPHISKSGAELAGGPVSLTRRAGSAATHHPRLRRTTPSRGQDQGRSHALPQALHRPRGLQRATENRARLTVGASLLRRAEPPNRRG